MQSLSKTTICHNPLSFLKCPGKAESPYTHMANTWAAAEKGNAIKCFTAMAQMYKSIEDRIAADDDPMAWKMVNASLDDIQEICARMVAEMMIDLSEDMWAVGLLGGK